MILNSMKIENVKGIKSRQIIFNDVTDISGANGTGKSTVYDSFLYLLFGRDSQGQAQFGIEPVDKAGNKVGGIPVIEAVIDGVTLRKELHEEAPKTRCSIDGVTKSITDYKAYVQSMIDEGVFKTLTDVHYVCEKMHHTERRVMLLGFAGDIGKPIGFEDLLAQLEGRTMAQFKKMCKDERLRITKARDEIQPRIDEIERGLEEYAGTDGADELKRNSLEQELKELEAARLQLNTDAMEREKIITKVQSIRTMQIVREAFLRSDNSRVAKMIKEKNSLANEAQQWASDAQSLEWSISEKQRIKTDLMYGMENIHRNLEAVRSGYKERKKPIPEPDRKKKDCGTCGALPEHQRKPITEDPQVKYEKDIETQKRELAELKGRGVKLNDCIKIDSNKVAMLEADIVKLQAELVKMDLDNKVSVQANATKLNRIEAQIAADVKVDPKTDKEWLDLQSQIESLTVGESVASQLQIIEDSKSELNLELTRINRVLSQSDRSEQDKKRIEELEAQEKLCNDQILELSKRICRVESYDMAESGMIEAAVNGMFKHVQWKLFRTLKNETVELCCDATLKGVSYSDLSYGEKILVGLDIVNVLAAKYNIVVPLFVDNAESYTPEIEWVGQVIKLIHCRSQKTLKIA